MSNRIFYAVQAASVLGSSHGIQSVSVNASVDFEQAFQLGTLQICEHLEGVPNVEISSEKSWSTAAQCWWAAAGGTTALVSANQGAGVSMSLANDQSATFQSSNFVSATNMSLSSWSVTFPVDGFATETVTLVGNDIDWSAGSVAISQPSAACTGATFKRRQDVALNSRAQSIAFSCDVGREELFQLGKKIPYARPATFPVECSSDWEYLAATGSAGDNYPVDDENDVATTHSLSYEGVAMGSAKLAGTSYSGGDAGGGNATISFNYIGYNSLTAG
jgi:hypothetical protein